ncbi:hypothetical protein EL22_08000 [Halostagnicola sp. A56]|uniref:hypothetical protein n=1 Tax=Halostagnicola sp. A56 TaxID=1495067 RepID=UPI00049FA904|nr:hypothetical protein [Halostagnicola sp. A56]KDE57983.1 hypothetical protein EL22_08000 [Halostagnicola sp. A56]
MSDTTARTYPCPSPDCEFTAGGTVELAEHVNTEHPGEFAREDWPDTPAASNTDRESKDDEEDNDPDDG